LLVEAGSMESVSIRAIAEKVGCTPPAIYMHFSDKEELFRELCEARFAEFTEVIRSSLASSNDPLESLRICGRRYMQFALESPEHYRVLFMTRSPSSAEDPAEDRVGYESFMLLVDAVQGAMEAGAIKRDDPFITAITLWVGCHGLASLLISNSGFPWPDTDLMVEHMLDVQLYGLTV
jgi:AcrR family transcriptional regulator